MKAPRKKSAKGVKLNPSSSYVISHLPISIRMKILCGMPTKTLAACKCVCKSWLHLIRDTHFSQLHQARAPSEVCFQFYYDINTTKLYMGNFNFLNNFDPLNTLFEFPKFNVMRNNALHNRALLERLYFANSCNGLLCYYGESKNRFAVVWNPCTSELITFPAPRLGKGFSTCLSYGLGFSRKENKFKLLRVIHGKHEVVVGEVCTIEKECSWKTVGSCPSYSWLPFPYATFLQGTLHWVGYSDSSRSEIAIHTFAFEDDRFGRLALPSNFVQTYRNTHPLGGEDEERLGVLSGCIFITEYTDQGMSIWLMKEYGVQDSWTKLFSLECPLDMGLNYNHCLAITYMDNGEMLMKCTNSISTTIFFYNPVLKSLKVIGSGPRYLRVIAYRPSLVMLKDSMLGYKVHVFKPKCADLKQGKKFTTPDWWTPVKESLQHRSKAPLRNFC